MVTSATMLLLLSLITWKEQNNTRYHSNVYILLNSLYSCTPTFYLVVRDELMLSSATMTCNHLPLKCKAMYYLSIMIGCTADSLVEASVCCNLLEMIQSYTGQKKAERSSSVSD